MWYDKRQLEGNGYGSAISADGDFPDSIWRFRSRYMTLIIPNSVAGKRRKNKTGNSSRISQINIKLKLK